MSPRPSPSRLPGVVSGANRSPSRIPAPPLNASASSPLQKTLVGVGGYSRMIMLRALGGGAVIV